MWHAPVVNGSRGYVGYSTYDETVRVTYYCGTINTITRLQYYSFIFYYYDHFYFPAQLVGGFTLSNLLDKPWAQVSSLLPPGACLHFYRA